MKSENTIYKNQQTKFRRYIMIRYAFIVLLLFACSPAEQPKEQEEPIQPKAIVLTVIGDVTANGKKLSLAQEITDQEIVVGKNSLCDLQLLESDTLVVIRLKSFSKFRLAGKKIGSKKENWFQIFSGNAIFNASKTVPEDQIKTLTPTLTAGVRGTKYEVSINSDGTTRLFVLEGEVKASPRIPELEKLSKDELNKNKSLKTISNSLSKKEFSVKGGEFSEVSSELKKKLLKETNSSSPNEKEKLEVKPDIEDKLSEIEQNDMNFPIKTIDPKIKAQKLKEYDEITPFDKEKINNKEIRTQLIHARFKNIEKSWWQRFKEWLKGF